MKYLNLIAALLLFFSCAQKEQWTPLFNGENLDGLHVYGAGDDFDGWRIEDDMLILDPTTKTKARHPTS